MRDSDKLTAVLVDVLNVVNLASESMVTVVSPSV